MALVDEMIANNKEMSANVTAFTTLLRQQLKTYGSKTTHRALQMTPIAQAKGKSDKEIDLALDRFTAGLESNLVMLLRPEDRRFPVEIISTGSLNPIAHQMAPSSIAV